MLINLIDIQPINILNLFSVRAQVKHLNINHLQIIVKYFKAETKKIDRKFDSERKNY